MFFRLCGYVFILILYYFLGMSMTLPPALQDLPTPAIVILSVIALLLIVFNGNLREVYTAWPLKMDVKRSNVVISKQFYELGFFASLLMGGLCSLLHIFMVFRDGAVFVSPRPDHLDIGFCIAVIFLPWFYAITLATIFVIEIFRIKKWLVLSELNGVYQNPVAPGVLPESGEKNRDQVDPPSLDGHGDG